MCAALWITLVSSPSLCAITWSCVSAQRACRSSGWRWSSSASLKRLRTRLLLGEALPGSSMHWRKVDSTGLEPGSCSMTALMNALYATSKCARSLGNMVTSTRMTVSMERTIIMATRMMLVRMAFRMKSAARPLESSEKLVPSNTLPRLKSTQTRKICLLRITASTRGTASCTIISMWPHTNSRAFPNQRAKVTTKVLTASRTRPMAMHESTQPTSCKEKSAEKTDVLYVKRAVPLRIWSTFRL
mmetsp:Transcript_66370/g.170844  ORF Transcript_66370/g.170844 Transcript_66370/m.170844 type:complete len:244 (-) Transcript_66370:31-762(-)